MSGVRPPAGVVVDTMVFSWMLDDQPNALRDAYLDLIGERPIALAFQSVMELRYGALVAGWGDLRRRRLEREIERHAVLQPDDATLTICAELRRRCNEVGHAPGAKIHDGDRWIAAISIQLKVPLVSSDRVFVDAPMIALLSADA